tara:strand:+ start:248 stop:739 length:492 start_codon:yes stop_codon:yes gene_type:complete
MPSFDIVSKFDIQEVDNAVNIVKRDILNRYDFKGSSSSIALNKNEKHIKIEADNNMQKDAIADMLKNRSISRKLPLKIYDFQDEEKASGMKIRQYIILKEGISKDTAKIINKLIKNFKLKVQSQIQGDQLRVTGKKIDVLQEVIQKIKLEKLDIALQFVNLKK